MPASGQYRQGSAQEIRTDVEDGAWSTIVCVAVLNCEQLLSTQIDFIHSSFPPSLEPGKMPSFIPLIVNQAAERIQQDHI